MLSRAIFTLLSGYAYALIQREQQENPNQFLMKNRFQPFRDFAFLYCKKGRQCQPQTRRAIIFFSNSISIAPAINKIPLGRIYLSLQEDAIEIRAKWKFFRHGVFSGVFGGVLGGVFGGRSGGGSGGAFRISRSV